MGFLIYLRFPKTILSKMQKIKKLLIARNKI